jgi:SOS-response transcriptional repressor LexA
MIGLTQVQLNTVAFMQQHHEANGVMPSFAEIADHLGIKSKSRVFEIMKGLEERGAIRRLHGKARAVEIVPDDETRAVLIRAHVWGPLIQYAIAEKVDLETAVNEFISNGLGVA